MRPPRPRSNQPNSPVCSHPKWGKQLGASIMADIVTELANKCGISPEVAKKGLGIVLSLFKSKLPEETYSKVSAAVPDADNMIASAADMGEQSGGGVVDAV